MSAMSAVGAMGAMSTVGAVPPGLPFATPVPYKAPGGMPVLPLEAALAAQVQVSSASMVTSLPQRSLATKRASALLKRPAFLAIAGLFVTVLGGAGALSVLLPQPSPALARELPRMELPVAVTSAAPAAPLQAEAPVVKPSDRPSAQPAEAMKAREIVLGEGTEKSGEVAAPASAKKPHHDAREAARPGAVPAGAPTTAAADKSGPAWCKKPRYVHRGQCVSKPPSL